MSCFFCIVAFRSFGGGVVVRFSLLLPAGWLASGARVFYEDLFTWWVNLLAFGVCKYRQCDTKDIYSAWDLVSFGGKAQATWYRDVVPDWHCLLMLLKCGSNAPWITEQTILHMNEQCRLLCNSLNIYIHTYIYCKHICGSIIKHGTRW